MKHIFVFWMAVGLIIAGCEETCEEVCEPQGVVNDITDLIGFIDPNQTTAFELSTLYVKELFLADVLAALEAVENSPGVYTMGTELFDGTMEQIFFTASFTESPYLFLTNDSPEELKSKHKIYIDAECKEGGDDPQITPCRETEDGYTRLEFLGWDRCEKGSGICVEILKITWIKRIYEDSGCTILVDTETTKQYDC